MGNKSKRIISGMRGIIPSLHTPFCRDNKVDILSLQKLIDHTILSGCAGMLVGAVAGENASLSLDEKEIIINACVQHNNNRLPLIVSCSANNQYDRITLSRAAKVAGADWILCQTPNNLNGNELTECFNEIADAGPSNLMIQDLSWTDNGMNDEDILLLFENIKKFKGLKIEVLNSGPKYSRILKATDHKLHLSGGWAIMGMIEALNRGVHAFIPSTMEVIYNQIYNLFIEKKINKARDLFSKILPIVSFTHQHIDIAIKFSKMLRVKEEIFITDLCRSPISGFDIYQLEEADIHIEKVISLQNNIN
ncbi:dihydrodipicolinate synthase family protein [Candidatus Levibacter sp. Uisw_134_01]|uniref:dihydrodipicolinate synthase family protein n=1 Tax=Candidatus Levibacter sp. Uisw_134_01 TaxID=3230999 RepID=UPI003D3948FC